MAIEKKFPRKLNNSVDSRLRKGNEMSQAMNVQTGGDTVSNDEGGDAGVLKPANGNTAVASTQTGIPQDIQRKVIGKVEDQKYRRVYLFVWASNKAYEGVYIYDADNDQTSPVYLSPYFNFDQNGFVKGDVVHLTDQSVEGDEKTYLYFTDNVNEPRRIDLSRVAEDQGEYTQYDLVDFMTACPVTPQKPITFDFSFDPDSNISNLENTNGFIFAYQNVYTSGEVSPPSVYSDIAVIPSYLTQGATPLSNLYLENVINLRVPRRGYTREVEFIRVLVKYGHSNSFFIVDDVAPDFTGDTVIEYRNNELQPVVTKAISTQQFSSLPRIAESQAVMEDRLFYGNYVEGRDRTNVDASLQVRFSERPQDLVDFNIGLSTTFMNVGGDSQPEDFPFDGITPPTNTVVQNRISAVELNFNNVPDSIEAGSTLRFSFSFAPTKNFHLYQAGGEHYIHGHKQANDWSNTPVTFTTNVNGVTNTYESGQSGSTPSISEGFKSDFRGVFGVSTDSSHHVNHDGNDLTFLQWETTAGPSEAIGSVNATIGSSALTPLIVKGSNCTFEIDFTIQTGQLNRFEMRRLIGSILSQQTPEYINEYVGYELVTEDPSNTSAKVLVNSKKTLHQYEYNLGLQDGTEIVNDDSDGRSGLICAVGRKGFLEYEFSVKGSTRNIPPCGYFVVNKAGVGVTLYNNPRLDATQEPKTMLGVTVEYFNVDNTDGDGILTCLPSQGTFDSEQLPIYNPSASFVPQSIKGTNWTSENPDSKNPRIQRWKTYTKSAIQNPDGITTELGDMVETIKGGGQFFVPQDSFITGQSIPSSWLGAPADQEINEINRIVGFLNVPVGRKIYYGPNERAGNNGVQRRAQFLDRVVSISDGDLGPGGSYRTRIGADHTFFLTDGRQGWLDAVDNPDASLTAVLDPLRDQVVYEGSVSIGIFYGLNTYELLYSADDVGGNPFSTNQYVVMSALPQYGHTGFWSKYDDGSWSSATPMALNYYPSKSGQSFNDGGEYVIDGTVLEDDGYVDGGARGYFSNEEYNIVESLYPGSVEGIGTMDFFANRLAVIPEQGLGGRTFKSSAFHDFGIVYYDQRGRPGPVNRIGTVYVPGYSSSERGETSFGSSSVRVVLNSAPPAWAFDYQIVYSGNTTVSDFVQYSTGGAFVSSEEEGDDDSGATIYVSLNYLQGKDGVSYTNEFGAIGTEGDKSIYDYKPGDRLRVISYYLNNQERTFLTNLEFDVSDYRILTNDPENNPLYDPAVDGAEVPSNKTGTFIVLKNNIDAEGFSYIDILNNADFWNNRCLVEIFSPIRDQDSEDRAYYEISQAYEVVRGPLTLPNGTVVPDVIQHSEPIIELTEGDVWWRNAAVNMPDWNGAAFDDLALLKKSRFRGYYIESKTFTDSIPRADVKFFGKPKFYSVEDGEVRRRSSVTYGDRNDYSENTVRYTNFNPNALPFKDLSNKYGAINYLEPFDEFLLCMQENKISRLPISRSLISDATGNESLVTSTEIVGSPAFYSGSFGTDNDPSSVTVVDNNVFFTHRSKKEVLRFNRLEGGVRVISDNGMDEFFDQNFDAYGRNGRIVTGYDPDNDEFLISMSEATDSPNGTPAFVVQPPPQIDTPIVVVEDLCGDFEIVGVTVVNAQFADSGGSVTELSDGYVQIQVQNPTSLDNSLSFVDNQGNVLEYETNNYFTYTVTPVIEGEFQSITVSSLVSGCTATTDSFLYTANNVCEENGSYLVAVNQTDFETNNGVLGFGFSNGTFPDDFTVTLTSINPLPQVLNIPYEPLDQSQLDSLASEYNDTATYGTWFAGGQYYVFNGLEAGTYNVAVTTYNGLCSFAETIAIPSATDPCLTVEQVNFITTPIPYDPDNPTEAASAVTIEWSSGFTGDGIGDLFYAYEDPVATNAVVYNYIDYGAQITEGINGNGNYTSSFILPAGPDYNPLTDTEAQVWFTITNSYGCTILNVDQRTLFFTSSPCAFSNWDELISSVVTTNETFQGLNDGTITVTPLNPDIDLLIRLYDSGVQISSDSINELSDYAPAVFDNLSPGQYSLSVFVSENNGTGIDGCEYFYDGSVLIFGGAEPPPPADPFAIDIVDNPAAQLIYSSVDDAGVNTYPSGIATWSSGTVSVVETTIEGVFGNWIKVQTGGNVWSGVDLNIDSLITNAMNENDKIYVCFDLGSFGQIGNTPTDYNGPGGNMWNHRVGDNNNAGANYASFIQEDTTFTWDGVSYTATAPANIHYNFDMGVSRRSTGKKTWQNGWNGSISLGYYGPLTTEEGGFTSAADMYIRNIRIYRIPATSNPLVGNE